MLYKCKFAEQEHAYLGKTVHADSIEPSANRALLVCGWPQALKDEQTRIRRFLGTANFCRIFLELDYVDNIQVVDEHTWKLASFHLA